MDIRTPPIYEITDFWWVPGTLIPYLRICWVPPFLKFLICSHLIFLHNSNISMHLQFISFFSRFHPCNCQFHSLQLRKGSLILWKWLLRLKCCLPTKAWRLRAWRGTHQNIAAKLKRDNLAEKDLKDITKICGVLWGQLCVWRRKKNIKV